MDTGESTLEYRKNSFRNDTGHIIIYSWTVLGYITSSWIKGTLLGNRGTT
jgi:hypothetical protein